MIFCQEPWDNLTGNSHIHPQHPKREQIFCKEHLGTWNLCGCGAEVILQVEANSETLQSLGVPLLAGVSKGHIAHAGATLGNQYTLAGVNRAWQGIQPEQGRGCSTIIAARVLADPFSLVWKKNVGTHPYKCLASKKGARQTKLTTAL